MKKILKNTYLLIGITLIAGGMIGWLIKPSHSSESGHQHTESAEDQIWTCSMHPQIRLHEPGSCPICGMALIPVSSNRSGASYNPMVHEMTPEAVAMAGIHTSRVSSVAAEGELFLTGKIQADERQRASVTAKYPGRIEQLYINFTGQEVRSGDRLATIYSPRLVTAQKELLEAAQTKQTFPELYAASREKLRLWKLTEEQINTIEVTGTVNDQFDILADRGGVVTRRNVSVGDYVDTGTILFDIVDLSKVWILADAYETDLPFIKIGDNVSFTAAGIPGNTFNAKITYIDPMINVATRAASVRAEAVNPNGELKPEMFVDARIRTTARSGKSSLAIPRTALLWSGKRSIVYVKVQNSDYPAFEMREITIGPRMGEMYLVEEGLEAGEEIVTNGVFYLDSAAQLAGNYSMLMRPRVKTMEVPDVFRGQITAVADAYFEVKNALVSDDADAAGIAVLKVRTSLKNVGMGSLSDDAHNRWMAVSQQLSRTINMMENAATLEAQREHFAMLSESILEMTEYFGLEKDRVFKEFCPMAFDDEGAYWLSESEEIRNPYFGASMLNCGEVTTTYRKGQKVFETGGPDRASSTGGHNH